MGLRIQNNISAMNAHRQLTISDNAMAKSLERLSSGYRINKAADDAAGLAISQGFRADIASFKVASRNTSEASALLQVAEGGMDQIGNMLTRLKELATQASSANVGDAERIKINSEGDQILAEIDRIANSTKYGSTALIDGSYGNRTTTMGAPADHSVLTNTYNYYTLGGGADDIWSNATVLAVGSAITEQISAAGGTTWYVGVDTASDKLSLQNSDTQSAATLYEVTTSSHTQAGTIVFDTLGVTLTITAALDSGSIGGGNTATGTLEFYRTGLTSINAGSATADTYTFSDNGTDIRLYSDDVSQTITQSDSATSYNFSNLNISVNVNSTNYDDQDFNGVTITVSGSASNNTFQVGAENNADNQISISLGNVKGTESGGLNLSTGQLTSASAAQAFMTTIDTAISSLSSNRGTIGAYMNRLSYAAANLSTTIENVQAAESVIRDVDMASEMTTFTKNQILLQAGTAMLAQANMAPQQVLSLFG